MSNHRPLPARGVGAPRWNIDQDGVLALEPPLPHGQLSWGGGHAPAEDWGGSGAPGKGGGKPGGPSEEPLRGP